MRRSPLRARRRLGRAATAAIVVCAAITASVGSPGPGVAPAAAALPAGFTDTPVAVPSANPLSQPTTIVALPGGRALVLEKAGAVRILAGDSLRVEDALRLAVCTGSEMGLLGAAVDPEFRTNGWIYLFYTRSAGNCGASTGRVNRVSRFTMVGDVVVPTSEVVLLDNIPANGGNHNGGDLEVGNDGYLYVAIGDAGTNPRGSGGTSARDLSLLTGKIVRITTSGLPAPGNPLLAQPGVGSCATAGVGAPTTTRCAEIYAWGLRNPYRFAFDPNTGQTRFRINDVGQNTWEEVNEGQSGADYGWNAREGRCLTGSTTNCSPPNAGVVDPIVAYSHASTGCSYITAGAFAPNGMWPKEYDDAYLFADGGCNRIWRLGSDGSVDWVNPFHQVSGGIVDMAFVPTGLDPALYYVTVGGAEIRKITADVPPASSSAGLAYEPLPVARRVYDTRIGIGTGAGPVRADGTRLVDLGISDPAARAALVNITVDSPSGPTYVVASQPRTERVSTSNLNAAPGEIVANASIVAVDEAGDLLVSVFGTTHLIIDVLGVFREPAPSVPGGRFNALSPDRLFDTREATSSINDFDRAGVTITAPVAGRLGIPTSASAVVVVATALSGPSPLKGFVTVHPAGSPVPPTSNVNTNGNNDIRPNLVVVPIGTGGSISAHLFAVDDLVIDVVGYVANAASSSGLFHLTPPTRVADSRGSVGFGRPADNGTVRLTPTGAVPAGAAAIVQNVTMTNSRGAGWTSAYPGGAPLPTASDANTSGPDQNRASLTITRLGGAGSIDYTVSRSVDLVVDITGYFD